MSCEDHYFDNKGQFSRGIDNCKSFILRFGFSVESFADLSKNVAGQIDYENKTIKLNSCCAGCAFIAITHEAGHLLHWLECGDFEDQPLKKKRESEANKRGWKLVKKFGMSDLISRTEYYTS